jgi:hypothetical protein
VGTTGDIGGAISIRDDMKNWIILFVRIGQEEKIVRELREKLNDKEKLCY